MPKIVLMNGPLPKLADVIWKVRQLQELTPEEEFIYLVYIEEVPEHLAQEMIAEKMKSATGNQPGLTSSDGSK